MDARRCSEHPGEPAPRSCASCGRWLCVACWRFNVDGRPWCAPCVELVRRNKDRLPLSFVLTALLLATGCAIAAIRGGILGPYWAAAVVAFVALLVLETARSMRGEESLLSRQIAVVKDGVADRPSRKLGRVARRTLETAIPSWSSRTTVLVVLAGFGAASLLVPKALALPRYVETELVLVAWLGILWVTLAIILYRGARLGDDHVLHVRAPDFSSKNYEVSESAAAAIRVGGEVIGNLQFDGCAIVSAVIAVAALVLGASWLLVELLFPAFFLVAYTLLRGALTRVTNDAHDCAGSVPRALAWGLVWSGIYTAPLAAFVVLLHAAGYR